MIGAFFRDSHLHKAGKQNQDDVTKQDTLAVVVNLLNYVEARTNKTDTDCLRHVTYHSDITQF